MDSFLLALIGVFVISLGGRDQLHVARLTHRLGASRALLLVACLVSVGSAAAMAWAGAAVSERLPGAARAMLVAFALLAAAIELAWPVRLKDPKEPTRSLGAIGLVLLARQLSDAARFAIFAFAAATVLAPMAGLGGAIGGSAALLLGWTMGADLERRLPLRTIRRAIAAILLAAAIFIGLSARGAMP